MPVLIIDDEQDICFMLSNVLKAKLYKTVSVHNIKDAADWLSNNEPRFVFLDNNLPDGRGVDFLPEIKKLIPEIKIAMITAYDTQVDRTKAFNSGADDFIGKPFTRSSIYKTLDKFL